MLADGEKRHEGRLGRLCGDKYGKMLGIRKVGVKSLSSYSDYYAQLFSWLNVVSMLSHLNGYPSILSS